MSTPLEVLLDQASELDTPTSFQNPAHNNSFKLLIFLLKTITKFRPIK